MENKFNYKMLILARESRGLNQSELAEKTGLPQSTISRIEHGFVAKVDDETINTLSSYLNYPKSFFNQSFNIFPHNLYYRKRLKVNAKTINKAEAIMNIYRANVQSLLKSVDLPETNIPIIDETRDGKPDRVAMYLRQFWKIPKGPIMDLTKLLEGKGIIIIPLDFDTEHIEGLSMITDTGNYIIFLNNAFPGDRQRLTLAHELGHLIMHLSSVNGVDENVDVEKEAFLFASEFLMPKNEIAHNYKTRLTINKLIDLKRYWKVSMQAILKWGQELGEVDYNRARYLWAQFNTMGIKKKEPFDLPKEKPSLLQEIINMHYSKDIGFTKKELADILCLSVKEFEQKYATERPTLSRIA
jgi:Zn-dependent peptidase ImmA (M78 family)